MNAFLAVFDAYLVPVGLGAIMFGLGLSLTVDDFRRVFVFPKAAALGLTGQLILLPAVAITMSVVLPMPIAVAMGLVAISGCPGGVSSNAFVFAMRGDVALSVSMTAISSTVVAFTLPFILWIGLELHAGGGDVPDLPVLRMLRSLLIITVLPVVIGMMLRAIFPDKAARTAVFFRPASLVFLGFLILVTLFANYDALVQNLRLGAAYSLMLNIGMMGLGFGLARWAELSGPQQATISYEIGIQNAGVAILVTRTLMGLPEYSIVPIIYGVIMMMSAFITMRFFRTRLIE